MSLTQPTAHEYGTKTIAVEEQWYIKLYYDTEASFLGLASKDLDISSVHYYGNVIDWGEIVESIDLANSQASASDAEITCANNFKNTTLMRELYGGTRKYLNRKVEIFSYVNGSSMQIYTGKLVNIASDGSSVSLSVISWRPWDNISIPQMKSSYSNVYEPIAYGDFEKDTLSNFYFGKKYYPVPFERRVGTKLWFIAGQSISSDGECYYYDRNIDKFVPITDASSSSSAQNGVNILTVPEVMERSFRIRATAANSDDFTATENIYDYDSNGASDIGSYASAYADCVYSTGNLITKIAKIDNIENPTGKITAISTYAYVRIDVTKTVGDTSASQWIKINNDIFSTDQQIAILSSVGNTLQTLTYSILSEYQSNGNQLPEEWQIYAEWFTNDAGSYGSSNEIEGTAKILDAYLSVTAENDFTNDKSASDNFLQSIKELYTGSDGLSKSYSGGSGLAELPHEIFRDLLARFTDFDFADSYMDNWSDLNTARSGWECRWWLLEPRPLIAILQQIQFEGCFIFKMKNDGSGGKFLWVKNTYSSSDVLYTFTETDYDYINIGITDFDDIVTWVKYNYVRHPAKPNTYLESAEYKNTTARSNWFASVTNENYEEKNLDFITADKVYNSSSHTDPNDCVALYYDNIAANPRIIIETNITNPAKMNIEAGDIIKFNDSTIAPFSKSWGDLYFMITETRRSPGQLIITAREVYEA